MQSNDREEKEIEVYEISDSDEELISAIDLREAAIQAAATHNQPNPYSPPRTTSAATEIIDLTGDGESEDDDDNQSEETEDEYDEYMRLSRPSGSDAFRTNNQRKRTRAVEDMTSFGKKRMLSNDMSLKYHFGSLDIGDNKKCRDCRYPFTSSLDTILSNCGKNGYCKGCYRLQRTCRWEDMDDIRHWLITGELNREVWENDVFNTNEEDRVKRVVSGMRSRLVKNRSFLGNSSSSSSSSSRPPSFEKLFNLYINCECKCAVTGWTCHFSQFRQNSWSVTFDHIVPLSIAPPGFDPWDISNIQVMSYLMNNIKGDLPDREIHRWFRVWKMGQLDRE